MLRWIAAGVALILPLPGGLFGDDVPSPIPADRLTNCSVEIPFSPEEAAVPECAPDAPPVATGGESTSRAPVSPPSTPADWCGWVTELGAEDWITRERAQARLSESGRPALGAVREGAKSTDPETRSRSLRLLAEMDRPARWTGALDEAWGRAENWSPRGVPDAETDVEIPPECAVYPAVRGMRAEARNLTIERGATLTVDDDSALRVGRDCVVFGTLRRERGLLVVEHILAITSPDSSRTQVWVKGTKKYEFRRDGMFPPPSGITARAEVLVLPDEGEGDDPAEPIPPLDPASSPQDDRTRW